MSFRDALMAEQSRLCEPEVVSSATTPPTTEMETEDAGDERQMLQKELETLQGQLSRLRPQLSSGDGDLQPVISQKALRVDTIRAKLKELKPMRARMKQVEEKRTAALKRLNVLGDEVTMMQKVLDAKKAEHVAMTEEWKALAAEAEQLQTKLREEELRQAGAALHQAEGVPAPRSPVQWAMGFRHFLNPEGQQSFDQWLGTASVCQPGGAVPMRQVLTEFVGGDSVTSGGQQVMQAQMESSEEEAFEQWMTQELHQQQTTEALQSVGAESASSTQQQQVPQWQQHQAPQQSISQTQPFHPQQQDQLAVWPLPLQPLSQVVVVDDSQQQQLALTSNCGPAPFRKQTVRQDPYGGESGRGA